MAEGSLPSNVHVLKPRALSLSERLDEFLEKHALAPSETPVRCDPTRPKSRGINAINCASCGQAEYLTRDYCRCGHYLRGQLEDEFLAWLARLADKHGQIEKSFEKKSKALIFVYATSLPFIAAPLVHVALASSVLSLAHLYIVTAGLGMMGLGATIESHFRKPVELSLERLNNATFEIFLEVRTLPFNEVDS